MFQPAPMNGPTYTPLETIEDVADALDLPTGSVDRAVLVFLHEEARPVDVDRWRTVLAIVVRAWELWKEQGEALDARSLRAQLGREGFPITAARG